MSLKDVLTKITDEEYLDKIKAHGVVLNGRGYVTYSIYSENESFFKLFQKEDSQNLNVIYFSKEDFDKMKAIKELL